MVNLADYLPNYYDEVVEMQQLMAAEQVIFDGQGDLVNRLLLNRFVMTADSNGLSLFEYELKIEVTAGESLEERRSNVLLRIMPPQAITIGYLRALVKSLQIPTTITVDSGKSSVKTFSSATVITPEQVVRLRYLLSVYLPANLAYVISEQAKTENALPLSIGFAAHTVVSDQIGAAAVIYEEV
ncbi:putative phage tail protein [Lactiplantibacillus herbarum]|uniref:putative phage tail protein n=1 Tax=Lactiplantibacillus herbarum TaxID=1670446 RepID=UPI00064E5C88|nr:putative phage tail protein [Lactiplantibacillus herbarum]